MAIGISGSDLTVYPTEVDPAHGGKGYAKMMLNEMMAYARENDLKVIALCPYVHAQFKKHPEEVADIWKRQ